MSFAYAFKVASEAAKRESGLAAAFSLEIAEKTGGLYSHVECWIGGSLTQAVCFSSREPKGTSIEIVNLSDPLLWKIVPVKTTPDQDAVIRGFCLGASGRRYDGLGIIGIATDQPIIHDPAAWFCSETGFRLGDQVLGIFPHNIDPWMVAPSWGKPADGKRFGLFELLTKSARG